MTGKSVSLTVNGHAVTATVEPRTHLADFLREQLLLTGTHLGCEHGVCGACTVEIDGEIARSCITFAVACDGARIRTIEGFDDDPVMDRLRRAFTEEHGLQCGYCTPGMLIAARDIVTRLPTADPRRIRVELSGNLCRCTGYQGIVAAVGRVIGEQGGTATVPPPAQAADVSPAAPATRSAPAVPSARSAPAAPSARPAPVMQPIAEPETPIAVGDEGMTRLEQSFVVRHPRDAVWRFMKEVERVAACMPGAALTEPVQDGRLVGQIAIKLGPIRAAFLGEGEMELDDAGFRGTIAGSGRDRRSATRAKGRVEYRLTEEDGGAATRVEVEVAFSLAGPLAQFSRGGIVTDLAARLTARFAENLEARLGGAAAGATEPTVAEEAPAALDAGGLLLSVVWSRIKAIFARLLGRG